MTEKHDAIRQALQKTMHPLGSIMIQEYAFDWTSKLVEPKRVGVYAPGLPSNFNLGLYDLTVSVSKDDLELKRFQTRRAGFEVARDLYGNEG